MKEGNSHHWKSLSPNVFIEPQGRERVPQAIKDDAPDTLNIDEVAYINGWQLGQYIAHLPSRVE